MQKNRWSISESIHKAIPSWFNLVRLQASLSPSWGPRPLWPWSLPLACLRAGCRPSLRWHSPHWGAGKDAAQLPALSSAPRFPLHSDKKHNTVFAKDALDLTTLNSCILKEGLMNKPTVLHPAFSRSRYSHDWAVDAGTVRSSVVSKYFLFSKKFLYRIPTLSFLFCWIRMLNKKLLIFFSPVHFSDDLVGGIHSIFQRKIEKNIKPVKEIRGMTPKTPPKTDFCYTTNFSRSLKPQR